MEKLRNGSMKLMSLSFWVENIYDNHANLFQKVHNVWSFNFPLQFYSILIPFRQFSQFKTNLFKKSFLNLLER